MTLFEQLQNHVGGLIRIKTQLFWYGRHGWDNNPGRICLLIDVCTSSAAHASTTFAIDSVSTLLLVDGLPKLIRVREEHIEIIAKN